MGPRHALTWAAGIAVAAALLAACGDNRTAPLEIDAAVCAPIDDNNPCTDDVCQDGRPAHLPLDAGTACAAGVCDGAGACVGCLEDGDCTGLQICDEPNRVCVDPTCSDGERDGTEPDVDCGGPCLPTQPCADGLHCVDAADCASGVCDATVCQAPRCGDGVMQAGEACDDGNDTNGDGCDDGAGDACRPTGCGNGVVSGTETCDDGNASDGDGCDNNCTPTGCGNQILTGDEECDDGDGADGDGCSATCRVEAGWTCAMVPSVCATDCGDGVRAGAEGCDDGDLEAGDGCSATCTAEPGWTCTGTIPSVCGTTCGDGVAAGFEVCDDGNHTNGDGCDDGVGGNCRPSGCGNGVRTGTEVCDDGNAVNGDGCDNNCTVTACGNGVIAGPETCDQGGGNVTPGDGCSATCVLESGWTCVGGPSTCTTTCGDGIPAGAEACDDAPPADSGDGCSATCTVEAGYACTGTPSTCTASCGDGIRAGAEACDDAAPAEDGDGCSATCAIESGWTCTGSAPSTCATTCGDGIRAGTEACDDAAPAESGDGCSATCTVENGWTCTGGAPSTCATTCGDGIIAGAETCDQGGGNVAPGDGCSATCVVESGWTCSGATSTCTTTCGDGVIAGSETCDQGGGNVAPGDGCSAACAVESGWTCSGVTSTCATTCGDGVIAGSETCDQGGGNVAPGDGCSASCTIESGWTCGGTPSTCVTSCGDGVIAGAETCDEGGGNVSNGDGCSATCAVEPGYTCTGTPSVCAAGCGDGIRAGAETCDDGGNIAGDGCSASCTVETGWTCVGQGPGSCSTTCGDGIRAGAEACDDAAPAEDGDGCSASCAIEAGWACVGSAPSTCAPVCGDGIVAGAEQCDQGGGNVADGDGCSASCTVESGWSCVGVGAASCGPICGDGLRLGGETCDDAGVIDGDGCSATCAIETGWACPGVGPGSCAPVCGDGIKAGAEQCDQGGGNVLPGDGCSAACAVEVGWSCVGVGPASCGAICGDGVLVGGETCDQGGGNVTPGDGCSATCAAELGWTCTGAPSTCVTTCGDGVRAGAEACDDGCLSGTPNVCEAADNGDGCSATCTNECGNGALGPNEQCDDGNTANGDGCSATCAFEVTCAPGDTLVQIRSTDVPKTIVDNVPAGVDSVAVVPVVTAGAVRKVVVGIGSLAHAFDGDVVLSLASPAGRRRILSNQRGGSGDNFVRTRLDDGAATAISAGSAPFTGAFRPDETISDARGFLGENVAGTWSLRAADVSSGISGTLDSWTLSLCVAPGAACGNGALELGEECDDGNTSNADACSSACRILDGCGDGNLDGAEQCDDDNLASGDGCAATCEIELTCAPGQVRVAGSNNTAFAIPDNNATGISSPIALPTAGAVTKVVAVVNNLTHGFDGDVDMFLIGPTGQSRELSTDNSGVNYVATYFDDAAATAITAGTAPYTGRFRPETTISTTALVDFRAANGAGTWNLKVADDASGGVGTLNAWALALCVDPTGPYCGDGIAQPGEECDTAGASATCSGTCLLLDGCGDGNLDAGEYCDDNNIASGDGCSSTCQPDITCAAGQTPVVLTTSVAQAIPDNNPTGVSSPIAVTTAGAVKKVLVTVGGVTHPNTQHLDISLISPLATTRNITDDNNTATVGANYRGTTFDDAATALITSTTGALNPFTGTFKPESSMATTAGTDFTNQNALGTWNLKVADDTTGTTGTVDAWALALCLDTVTFCGNGVIEPGEECDTSGPSATCGGTCQLLDGCGDGNLDAGEQCDDDNLASGDGCAATCQLEITCAPGEVAVTGVNSAAFAIPDNNATGVSSSIVLPTSGAVTKVVAVVNSLTHGFDGDVDMFLIGPSGLTRELSTDQTGVNYTRTYFDDAAATAITSGSAPYTGRFRPETTLSTTTGVDFRTGNGAGTWSLKVADDASGGVGTLNSWAIALCVNPTATYCGDGVVQAGEECDAAGPSATCGATCQLIDGCGDGNLDAGEQCDDDNLASGDNCSAACQVEIACGPGEVVVSGVNSAAFAIPDNNATGISSPIALATTGGVTKVVAVVNSLTHGSNIDVDMFLVGPSGQTRELSTDQSGSNYTRTYFDDAAATAITGGTAPYTGRFRPETTLSTAVTTDFRGANSAGTWNLKVIDDAAVGTGTLNSWALAMCVDVTGPYCGNGVVDGGEECDTGGASATCSAQCGIVDGCGDGNIDLGEVCDDDNFVSGDGCSAACQPDISCGAGETPVVLANTSTAAIPDTHTGLLSLINQPTAGLVRKAIATINIAHANTGHLDVYLVSPFGNQRALSTDNGAAANYLATAFSDAAGTAIAAGAPPYTGTFRPQQTLSDAAGFAGQTAAGNWMLKIGDDTVGTTGTLNGWTLALCVDTAAAAVCGNGYVENSETCDDGNTTAGDGCSAACGVELTCAVGAPVIVTSSNAPLVIPDSTAAGITSAVTVGTTGTVRSAVVVLHAIPHTFAGSDLDLSLISPLGTTKDLSSDNSGADFFSTMFSDGATATITAASGPHRGRFLPEAALSGASPGAGYAGEAAAGTWQLKAVDDTGADVGVLGRYTLALCVE